ncbi:MAG: deoxyribose-phosphate aldolase [Bacteroidales bacterium]|jgi:deoxyribose-phosphate aldolase|nr:deoxyribose-phosphate aldolase [Bacteroidales bacterium]
MKIDYDYSDAYFQQLVDEIAHSKQADGPQRETLYTIYNCLDHTSLNSTDSESSIRSFCRSTLEMRSDVLPGVAAVCVYPAYVAQVKKLLEGSGIRVAAVAGGFPVGQLPLQLKCHEVRYLIDSGADEVDLVINRGAFLQGSNQSLFDEVAAAKAICGEKKLKVILETGELQTPARIYVASMLALQAGADFIKTSTGKISIGATPLSACVMMTAMRDFLKNNASTIGFKAAGGVSTVDDAWFYYLMMKKILNIEVVNNQNFRIGTSRLTPQLFNFLTIR